MWEKLLDFDDYLVERVFQPVTDWLAPWCEPRTIARFLLGLALCFEAPGYLFIGWGEAFFWPISAIAAWFAGWSFPPPRIGTLPYERIVLQPARIYSFFMTLVLVPSILKRTYEGGGLHAIWLGASCVFLVAIYFAACSRNPPKPKKVRAGDFAWAGAS